METWPTAEELLEISNSGRHLTPAALKINSASSMLTTVSAFSFGQARLWGWGTHSVWWKPRCRSGLSDNSDLCQRNLCVYRITYLNNICDFYGHLLLTSVAIHFWQVFAFTCTPCCCLVGRPQRLHRHIFPFSSFSTLSSFPHTYGAC